MDYRLKQDLDRWLTTPPEEIEKMTLPANTEVTCPSCDTEFTINREMNEEDTIHCTNCDTRLILLDGDFEEYEESEDIYEDDEDDDDEEEDEDDETN